MNQWSLEPVFGWIAVIPLALIMLASLWLTLTSPGLSRGKRGCLLLIRLTAVIVLLLGWLRPGLVNSVERETDSAIAVLIDASQSMTLPSGSSEQNRWEVVRECWETIRSGSQSGFGKTRFVPYFFDSSLRPLGAASSNGSNTSSTPDLTSKFQEPPTGRSTDLGTALADLQRSQADPPLRAAFLLTDGVQTVLPARTDPSVIARQMAQLDQPLVVLGIGPRSENSQLRDLAIESVPEHLTAFEKNRVSVPAVIQAKGLQNVRVQLKMTLKASGKPDIPLKGTELVPSRPEQTLPLNIEVEAPASGEYLLEIQAIVDAKEQVTTNNSAISFMTVRSGGSRILYIEGQPRYEQAFLKSSINASLDFQVDYIWIQQLHRSSWPKDLAKEHNFNLYDAFILGDVDASALSPSTLNALRGRVESGAGIVFLGGYHSYDAGGFGNSPLAPVYPVALNANSRQSFDGPIDQSFHIAGPNRLIPKIPHPITSFAPEPENSDIWKSLKPLESVNRLGKPKVGNAAQVIAEGADGQPLLITGEFGRGRVLACAGDSTWQWWMQGQKLRHKQFWRQAVLWLLGRDSLQEGFRLALDRRRILLGEEETVGIEWVGGSKNKPMPSNLRLELSHEGKWLRALDTQSAGENRRQLRLKDLNEPGLYRLELKATADDGTQYTSDIAFVVRDESRELTTPIADWQTMNNIASASELAGGRLIQPEQLNETLEWLRQRQAESRVKTIEKRRLGDGTVDAWGYFLLFCLIMTTEWGLRKRWQLP